MPDDVAVLFEFIAVDAVPTGGLFLWGDVFWRRCHWTYPEPEKQTNVYGVSDDFVLCGIPKKTMVYAFKQT